MISADLKSRGGLGLRHSTVGPNRIADHGLTAFLLVIAFFSSGRVSKPQRRSWPARLSKPDRLSSLAIAVPPVAIFIFALRKPVVKATTTNFRLKPDDRCRSNALLSRYTRHFRLHPNRRIATRPRYQTNVWWNITGRDRVWRASQRQSLRG